MVELSMLPVLVTLLALASVWDAALHRIPNALVVAVAATGAFARAIEGGAVALGWSLLAVVVVGALVWPAWSRRWIGGGDLKLAAAAAAWLELARIPAYLVASAVAVGVVAIACYALSARTARAEVRRNLTFAARGLPVSATIGPQSGRVQVPAGLGFAVGALFTVVRSGGV